MNSAPETAPHFAMSEESESDEARTHITRKELHFRRIDMRGYSRSDGLFEVEGRVTDRKPHDFTSPNGVKTVPANAPIHDMGVRLVFDSDMVVHDAGTFTSSAPYHDCLQGGEALKTLKGVSIAKGWTSAVRSRLSGAAACTHLMEILFPMGSAAYQSLTMLRASYAPKVDAEGRPGKLNSCYAYGTDRGVVMYRWPQFYTGPSAKLGQPTLPGPGERVEPAPEGAAAGAKTGA